MKAPKSLSPHYYQHKRITLNTGDFTYTKQSCKDECDINNILKQYQKTGIINHITSSPAQYIDLPSEIDFQSSMQLVQDAEYAFSELPAKVRDKYQNSPANFLLALNNPAERPFLEEIGVLKPTPLPTSST